MTVSVSWGFFLVGVLLIRIPLHGVYVRAPEFGNSQSNEPPECIRDKPTCVLVFLSYSCCIVGGSLFGPLYSLDAPLPSFLASGA